MSLNTTNIVVQEVSTELKHFHRSVVKYSTYLDSTICNNPSMDVELSKQIGKQEPIMARPAMRVWYNRMPTINTRMMVYQA